MRSTRTSGASSTTTDVARPASKFEKMVRQMLEDDELRGNQLLLAIALAEAVTSGNRAGTKWMTAVRESLGVGQDWIKWTLAEDRPRYEPRTEYPLSCRGQMIRRPGLCEQRGTNRYWLWDPDTGYREEIGACSRHRVEVQILVDHRRHQWIAAGKPQPPGNKGGILEKYFSADWDKIYTWASPRWERPPAGMIRTDIRPLLRLIPGGLE